MTQRHMIWRRLASSLLVLAAGATGTRALPAQQAASPTANLLAEFAGEQVFWRQFEVARTIVETGDASVLEQMEGWLDVEDRHVRGNVAFIFAGLGDGRGWGVLHDMLTDMSERPAGQGIPAGRFSVAAQIGTDRYYAVHLLGQLRDQRAVPMLAALLDDERVNYKVAWALGEIGGEAAVDALLRLLDSENPDARVIAMYSLAKLRARHAQPRLHELLGDNEKSRFGVQESVSEAARRAIDALEAPQQEGRRTEGFKAPQAWLAGRISAP